MAVLSPIKSGDTLGMTVTYTDYLGVPIDITGIAISSQVRDGNSNLIAMFTIVKGDQIANPGQFSMTSATSSWPINTQLEFDIKYITPVSVITHTDPVYFRVIPAITA